MPSILNATTTSGLVTSADNSGSLQLQTNNGTTAVTIDTSQNVGVGTASPVSQLTLAKTSDLVFTQNGYGVAWGVDNGSPRIYGVSSGTLSFKSGGGSVAAEIDSSSNFRFNSGYGSVATAYGCRAWVNFNGQGTIAIRASGNVSSITDNGTGDYTINFTNAMPNANYGVAATSTFQAGVTNAGGVVATRNTGNTTPDQTASGVRIIAIGVSNPAEADSCQVNVAIFR